MLWILLNSQFKESSFNMTRREMKILRGGGAPKIFRHPKGGSEKIRRGAQKICIKPTGEVGAPKKLNR